MMITTAVKPKEISTMMPPRLKHTSSAEADCNAMEAHGRGIRGPTVACAGASGRLVDSRTAKEPLQPWIQVAPRRSVRLEATGHRPRAPPRIGQQPHRKL